jgi:RHS repeat-associated protein
MRKFLLLSLIFIPFAGKSYPVSVYLTSSCSNIVVVSGTVVGDYPWYDNENFSFPCAPGDVEVLHVVNGIGPAAGIFWYDQYTTNFQAFGAEAVHITAGCTFPSTNAPSAFPPRNNYDFGNNNNGGKPTGCGMPVWDVSEPFISLWLHDEPLGYQPATGPRVSFGLDFKQRESNAGYNTNWFSVGKKWNCSWMGYVTLDANTNKVVNFPDGGQVTYYSNNIDALTSTLLTGDTTNGFTLSKSDGSQDVYGFIVTNSMGAFEEAFLSQRYNAQGQRLTLNYFGYTSGTSPVIRLQSVVDGDGRTNVVYYNSTNAYSTNLISQVMDPFGRTANLGYNSNGNLTNITDVATNSTAINYDTNDWVTSMVTPYGTTSFVITDSGTNATANGRSILVTRPDSSHELYLYEDSAPGVTNQYDRGFVPNTSPVLNLFENVSLDLRNTFHWGPRQYEALSTTNIASFNRADFMKAHMKHWLLELATNVLSGTLSLERESSPDSAGTIEGQKIWYDYAGKPMYFIQGTSLLPSLVARVLPDGTTDFRYFSRNPYGLAATNISTYSIGGSVALRTNVYVYAANNIDLVAATNALNVRIFTNLFNAYHQVATNQNALNETTVFTYNANHQLLTATLPTGAVENYFYDANNLLSSNVVVGFATNSFTWANDLVLTHTDPRGLATTNTWDNLNRLTSTAFPDGSYVSNRYTILDLTATKDRLGNWTYFGYDNMRRNTTITNALGNVTRFTYCSCGALETISDALSDVTTYQYDNQSNPTNVAYADGYSVTTTYNLLHQVVSATDGTSSVTNTYNNQGLLISVSNALGQVQSTVYDALDRATNIVDANDVTITNTFDNLNRPLTRGYPDTGVESWGYTPNYSGATSYTNQIGNIVTNAYDALNRKTTEVYVGVTTNLYVYDGVGDMLTLTDGKNQTTTWGYDSFGRVTNKLDALGTNIFVYQYDANSRLTNRWSVAKGNTIYKYDALGNLTNVDYSGGTVAMTNLSMAYDALNRLTNMVDALGTTKYKWDSVGELSSEDGPWANDTVGYSYANRLRTGLSLTQPNASSWSQSYGYDTSRRLTSLASPAGGFGYAYDATRQMQVAGLTFPNGAYITNTFASVARLLSTKLLNSSAAVLDAQSYGYNLASQRFTETNTAGDYRNYTYDNAGELITAIGKEAGGATNRWQEQLGYAYDAAGNLNQRTNYALIQTFNVNTLNELTTVTNAGTLTVAGTTTSPATNVTVNTSNAVLYADTTFASTNQPWVNGNNTYTAIAKDVYARINTNSVTVNIQAGNNYAYDLNGNLITNVNQVLDYDDENELIRVTVASSWKNEFTYDGKFRRRIEKDFTWSSGAWLQTNEIHFVYDGNTVIQERDTNNLPLVTYTRAGSSLLARTDNGLLNIGSSSAHAFYHVDGNGNVTMLINSSQAVVAKYLYDPFGNALSMSGPLAAANSYRFASKEWNANTGFYYFGRRYYDPNSQRFVNRDPLAENGGLNLYGYCGNNPVSLVDNFGLWPCWLQNLWSEFFGSDESSVSDDTIFPPINPYLQNLENSPFFNPNTPIDPLTDPSNFSLNDGPLGDLSIDGFNTFLMTIGIGGVFGAGKTAFDLFAADTGITVASSGGGDILPATVVRQIQQGESVSDLIDEVAQLTYESGGQEHAIVSLQSGDRVIVSGGTGGIDFSGMDDLNRIILHTHPTTTGPSALDFQMLQQTGQQSSWIYELFGGGLTKFHQ